MKKRTLGLIIAGVAAASMIGTGFAAWVITANAQKTQEGQFKVDTVTQKTVTITPTFAEGEGTINFLAPAGATAGWLTNDGLNGTEKLSTVLNIAYGFEGDATAADFKVTYTIDYTDVNDAITANYITAPVLKVNDAAYTAGTAQTLSGASETLTIEFGWGSAFEKDSVNVNPYDYYLAKENTEANRNDAKTKLSGLQSTVDSASFTITITVTPATQA